MKLVVVLHHLYHLGELSVLLDVESCDGWPVVSPVLGGRPGPLRGGHREVSEICLMRFGVE